APFSNADGPCAGHATDCVLDTRTAFVDTNNKRVDSITAYGKYWNYFADTQQPWPDANQFTGALGQTVPYSNSDGPCAGHATDCMLDTRTSFVDTNNKRVDSITAYGKYWNYFADTQQPWPDANQFTGVLGQAVPYSNSDGPCAGHATDCVLDTRTFS